MHCFLYKDLHSFHWIEILGGCVFEAKTSQPSKLKVTSCLLGQRFFLVPEWQHNEDSGAVLVGSKEAWMWRSGVTHINEHGHQKWSRTIYRSKEGSDPLRERRFDFSALSRRRDACCNARQRFPSDFGSFPIGLVFLLLWGLRYSQVAESFSSQFGDMRTRNNSTSLLI